MEADNTPPVAIDLPFDSKHRLTWRTALREKVPSADGLRVVWNEEKHRFEAYPLT